MERSETVIVSYLSNTTTDQNNRSTVDVTSLSEVSAWTTPGLVLETVTEPELAVIGLPGPIFPAIHLTAICSLSVTVVISGTLLIYLCVTSSGGRGHRSRQQPLNRQRGGGQQRQQRLSTDKDDGKIETGDKAAAPAATKLGVAGAKSKQQPTPVHGIENNKTKLAASNSFWSWNVGERMVAYLALCDLLYGISHILDHAYMLATRINPPYNICAPMAFVLLASILSQWFVVIFSAVSACSLIVFGKKLPVGRYDWGFLFGTFGLSLALAGLAWGTNVLGPTGAWCLFNLGTKAGRMALYVLGLFQISIFGILSVSYGTIWVKIQRTARLMSTSEDGRYGNSARVMMIFVAAFILQWLPLVMFTIWSLVENPHIAMLLAALLLVNLGGLYNCVAYTVIRRRLQQQNASHKTQQHGVTFDHQAANNSNLSLATTTSAQSH